MLGNDFSHFIHPFIKSHIFLRINLRKFVHNKYFLIVQRRIIVVFTY